MAQHALKQKSPRAQSSARDKLAQALQRQAALTAEVEAGEKAYAESEDRILDARDALEKAKVAADEAPERALRHKLDLAMGNATEEDAPSLTVEAANAALEKAKADLESQRAFRDALEARLRQARESLGYAAATVRDRVGGVVREHDGTAKLIAKHAAVRLELYNLTATLRRIDAVSGIPPEHRLWEAVPYNIRLDPDARWTQALEALRNDPGAPLPD